jgi:hypothetical protein
MVPKKQRGWKDREERGKIVGKNDRGSLGENR